MIGSRSDAQVGQTAESLAEMCLHSSRQFQDICTGYILGSVEAMHENCMAAHAERRTVYFGSDYVLDLTKSDEVPHDVFMEALTYEAIRDALPTLTRAQAIYIALAPTFTCD